MGFPKLRKLIDKDDLNSIIYDCAILGVVYLFAHILLCLISGRWWDDWCLTFYTVKDFISIYSQHGTPWEIPNFILLMPFPDYAYRIVVFIAFYLAGVFLFLILRSIEFISEEDSFWIAALALTAPVNDARTTLVCYTYSVSLFLFFLSFFLITRLEYAGRKKTILIRIVTYILLLYAYALESLLVFTGLIWLYLFYRTFYSNPQRRILKNIGKFFEKYCDYVLLPFVFFLIKNVFFVPYGAYDGYNDISLDSLLSGMIRFPASAFKSAITISYTYVQEIDVSILVLLLVSSIVFLLVNAYDAHGEGVSFRPKYALVLLLLGIVVYLSGVFPYIVIRGRELRNAGVYSRDTMLAGIGLAVIIVALSRLIPVSRYIQNVILVVAIILGVVHFNRAYLNYQEDAYHQKSFEYAITNSILDEDDDTILCDFLNPSPIGGTRFYTLNGIYRLAKGETNKFFLRGIDELKYVNNYLSAFSHGYNCDDYNADDMTIDGILIVNNEYINDTRLVQLRFYELFDHDRFDEAIKQMTDAKYINVTAEVSDIILQEYENGTLTSEKLRSLSDFTICESNVHK